MTHVLGCTLTDALDQGFIRGVDFPKTREEHTHGLFADDTKVITMVIPEYINNIFDLFEHLEKPLISLLKKLESKQSSSSKT